MVAEENQLSLEDAIQISTKVEEVYDASKIQKLEGLEGVRKRPDMYIGDTNERGLHHCVFELVDNAIDESLAGHCTEIKVAMHLNGSCSVEDNGRGIPVDIHPVYKIPALELVMTNLHAGGKFGKGAYQVSGGLHGVGAKCVNAVSENFEVEVRREGNVYHMGFSQGKTTQPLHVIAQSKRTGTKITFLPVISFVPRFIRKSTFLILASLPSACFCCVLDLEIKSFLYSIPRIFATDLPKSAA